MQVDGASARNVLIARAPGDPASVGGHQRYGDMPVHHAMTRFPQAAIAAALAALGLPDDAPLSALAVEVFRGALDSRDPLGADLGQVRIVRASNLLRVPKMCLPA
jgi:hypothetical protein